MNDDIHQNERQGILTRLLDAVKQCQVRFGGRSELATDSDSRVSCLCSAWETSLQHGMKKNSKAFSAIKQMTERTGLSKVTDLFSDNKKNESDPVFWQYVKEHLTKHELERFNKLKLVNTEAGKGRAWLRASLNEHSLERYMHMLIEKDDLLAQFYDDWAFLRDVERNSMLPNMAAGLGSILFAITVDRPELNKSFTTSSTIHVQSSVDSVEEPDNEPRPVISEHISPSSRKREKKKKKKVANVVSFDGEDNIGTVITKTSHSDEVVANSQTVLYTNGENRECAEGTLESTENVDEVFSQMPEGVEGEKEVVKADISALLQRSSQVSSPSIVSANSNSIEQRSKSSTGSLSDLDPDVGTFMTPIGKDGLIIDSEMVPYSTSSPNTSIVDMNPRSGSLSRPVEIESASHAIMLAQQSLSNSSRTQGDGGDAKDWNTQITAQNDMSLDDLKQAVVAMMVRKDSVESKSKNLEGMLQHEMETSSLLRAEIEELKLQHVAKHDSDQSKLLALQKENELLKHQLKKYVSAVQMLRTEGINKEESLGINLEEPQPNIPPAKPMIDYCHEATEYEKKLIQVAEMHGELMEFNEQLHRVVMSKDSCIRQLRDELILLRGPLPFNSQSSQDASQEMQALNLHRPLINIWIPSAFLRGSSNNTHHVYQVFVRIHDEEWNVYRRYSQFHDMHIRLKKVYPLVGKFEFPPKKAIGKKDAKLVECRRHVFQSYLRNVINLMLEKDQVLATSASKEKLISYLPFFNDKADEGKAKKGKRNSASGAVPAASPLPEGGADCEREQGRYQGL